MSKSIEKIKENDHDNKNKKKSQHPIQDPLYKNILELEIVVFEYDVHD